jgi:hypothetical protein
LSRPGVSLETSLANVAPLAVFRLCSLVGLGKTREEAAAIRGFESGRYSGIEGSTKCCVPSLGLEHCGLLRPTRQEQVAPLAAEAEGIRGRLEVRAAGYRLQQLALAVEGRAALEVAALARLVIDQA